MTKYTISVRDGLILIWAAILILGSGCKQPNSPSTTGGSENPKGAVTITLIRADESGSLTVTPSGPVSISKTGSPASVGFTISGTGFSGFIWIVDGNAIQSSGNGITLSSDKATLTINAGDPAVKPGYHSITVYAMKDTIPWSPEGVIQFTVTQ